MIVRCPHCSQGNELKDDSEFDGLCCCACGSSLGISADPDETITAVATAKPFGHFRLLSELGNGAFGTVWKAKDEQLDRIVAVKVPRQQGLGRDEVTRFLREARAAAQLRHPNVVPVHEVGEYDGVPYIVSDYIEGVNLKTWLRASEPTPTEVASVCEKIALAVHHAHEHGIIHRDLKPSNIMVDVRGEPHVMDSGLAKRDIGDATLTLDGAIIGTPSYMSPEQAQGKAHLAGRTSDVYSLGVALFEMLTGELPFRGGRPAVMYKILTEAPPSPRSLNIQVPADLETVCLHCLEKEPSRRFQTCEELAEELKRFRMGFPVLSRPIGTIGRIWRWYSRNPRASVLTAGGYMLCMMMILTLWGLCGLIFISLGVQPIEKPMKAILELLFFGSVFYLPGCYGGVQVLNGKLWAIWLNLLVLFAASAIIVAIIGGFAPEIELLHAASDNIYAQYQLATLLGTMVLLGLVLHAIALLSWRQMKARGLDS